MENSAPSLKIFALLNCGNKNRRQNPVREFTKTIIPFALVGYEVIITNSRYALVGYFITSYPTRAHGIIVKYPACINTGITFSHLFMVVLFTLVSFFTNLLFCFCQIFMQL